MKEAYVSFDTAKLLKEKGFDWFTYSYYTKDDVDKKPYFGIETLCPDNWNGEVDEVNDLWFSAPTQQMASRWLIEEKNIYVTAVPDIGNSLRFYPAIYVIKGEIPEEYWFEYINSVVEELNKSYSEPQQAVDAALQYVLKNLI